MSSNKEVIYIDSEDDITTVIDKASSSKAGIIALVLPKRYATLKSSVNMKLLKKTIGKQRKKLVLITDDESLLPLAGSVGMFVASSLKSRPEVPKVAKPKTSKAIVEEEAKLDPNASVGELSGDSDATANAKEMKQSTASSEKSSKIKQIKESSKIKVPNFDKFRLRVVLIVLGVIALIVGWYVAFYVVPKADVVILAKTTRVDTDTQFTIDPDADENDLENNIVTGVEQEVTKTVTERFEATGEKDIGQKATGVMTVQNCDSSASVTIPAGAVFIDGVTGFQFVSDDAVNVPGGNFSGGGCSSPGEANVDVTAAQSGDSRNLSPRGYNIQGQSGFITGFGGTMSGGTSEVVKVVSQDDINKATKILMDTTDDTVRAELAQQFEEGTVVIDATFNIKKSDPKASKKAGDEASEATVSAQFTYSIIGVPQSDMDQILRNAQKELVDTTTQSILDSGASNVTTKLAEKKDGNYIIDASTAGYVGPEINPEQLAQEIAGMGYSEAIEFIKSRPGVGNVELNLSPFWVFSVPNAEKTTITIEISDETLQ